MIEIQPREIQHYVTTDSQIPFNEWFASLRDLKAVTKIEARIGRVENGNLGDYRSLGEGVFELRIDYGPGYRVYFGQTNRIDNSASSLWWR